MNACFCISCPLQCFKCNKKFSSSQIAGNSLNDMNQDNEDYISLCVFCRLKDPSRTLEQRSGQYLGK